MSSSIDFWASRPTTTTVSISSTFSAFWATPISASSPLPPPSNITVHPSLYPYTPSLVSCIVFAGLYLLTTIQHFYFSIYLPYLVTRVHNKHKNTIVIFVAALLSTLGFATRTYSIWNTAHQSSFIWYTVSQIHIILGPLLLCAGLYLLLAHLVRLCLPPDDRKFLKMSPKVMGIVFVTSDVISFLSQGAGIAVLSLAAPGNDGARARALGLNTLTMGLIGQVVTFLQFMIVFVLFCRRVSGGSKLTTTDIDEQQSLSPSGETNFVVKRRQYGFNPLVKEVVQSMWIASLLVFVRSVYRTVEFAMGVQRYLFLHEWPLWIFEAAPILLALFVLGWRHPVKLLQQKRRSAFCDVAKPIRMPTVDELRSDRVSKEEDGVWI